MTIAQLVGIVLSTLVFGLGVWQFWSGRHDRRDKANVRKRRQDKKSSQAAAAACALLQPEPLPVGWHEDQKIRVHNKGNHVATVGVSEIRSGQTGEPSVRSGGPLEVPVTIEPGASHDFAVFGIGSGQARYRLTWTDGRSDTLDYTWPINVPRNTPLALPLRRASR